MSSECIEHKQGSRGYAGSTWNKRGIGLHRKTYCLHHGLGRDAIEGLVIRHTCDNKRCINPEHLVAGTQKENLQDRRDRNRVVRKLCESQVQDIKDRLAAGETGASIAREYGVAHGTVYGIKHGRYWA